MFESNPTFSPAAPAEGKTAPLASTARVITTRRQFSSMVMTTIYVVGEADPQKAEELVRGHFIEIGGSVSMVHLGCANPEFIAAIGLGSGQFTII
jgi:hypothetical protein